MVGGASIKPTLFLVIFHLIVFNVQRFVSDSFRLMVNKWLNKGWYVHTVFLYERAMCSGEIALKNNHYYYSVQFCN